MTKRQAKALAYWIAALLIDGALIEGTDWSTSLAAYGFMNTAEPKLIAALMKVQQQLEARASRLEAI